MKKKISLLGLVLILVLSFTGCGKSETTLYDKAQMEQYAEFIISNFSSMSASDLDSFKEMSELQLNLALLNSGVPIEAENFLSMIEAWEAGVKDCGAYVSRGEYEMKVSNSGASITADAQFGDRDGTIMFTFDEKMNMESLTLSANYTTGEILQKAGMNTILGMGTVFVVLIFISFIISLFKYIPVIQSKFSGKQDAQPAKPEPAAPAVPAQPEEELASDTELVAVIAAAIAASEGMPADGFVVRSIKRRKSNKWS